MEYSIKKNNKITETIQNKIYVEKCLNIPQTVMYNSFSASG